MIIRSPKELALFVSRYRKKFKLSQVVVGNAVGLKQATISAFENKPESTKLETLFSILSAVNLDMKISPKDESSIDETQWKEEW